MPAILRLNWALEVSVAYPCDSYETRGLCIQDHLLRSQQVGHRFSLPHHNINGPLATVITLVAGGHCRYRQLPLDTTHDRINGIATLLGCRRRRDYGANHSTVVVQLSEWRLGLQGLGSYQGKQRPGN